MKTRVLKPYLQALIIITIIDTIIIFIRNMVVGSGHFNFLFFNLFLGLIPLLIALILHFLSDKMNKLLLILGCGTWLLFYPNSPYMITDIIHVEEGSPASFQNMVIYDALIIFLFSMLSMFYGFFSIKIMKLIFADWGEKFAVFAVNFSIIISSFGIYLGRILRLNSWDLFTQPIAVLTTIFHHLFPIHKNPVTYAIIFLFSFVQFSLLILMKDLDKPLKSSLNS